MLKQEFLALVARHHTDASLAEELWNELSSPHHGDDRFFHTLQHVEQMITALQPVKEKIEDWDTVLFSIFYHDVVYDVVRIVSENDNEESSAATVDEVLKRIGYPAEKIERCKAHILATKRHLPTGDNDTDYVTDTDLSVLGGSWEAYKQYMDNIRREYEIYPDNIFHAGRLKVLRRFLTLPRLFKSDHFHKAYEAAARENMERELEIISISK